MAFRRFELSDDKSNKFWEVKAEGASVTVRFGRIGTTGQVKTKDHGSPTAANAEVEKLVREKTSKGYVEVGASTSTAAAGRDVNAATPAHSAAVKALEDIKLWLVDQGATAIVENLNGPLSEDKLKIAEAALGYPIPSELRAIYSRHDGQHDWDPSNGNLFFPGGLGGFVGLGASVSNDWRRFIGPWFQPDFDHSTFDAAWNASNAAPLQRNPEQLIPRSWFNVDVKNTTSDLRPEECSTAWLVFAWEEVMFGVIHLRTGRVFQFEKDVGLTFVADSFGAFLKQYADDLENGKHKLVRNRFDDGPLEERSWAWT